MSPVRFMMAYCGPSCPSATFSSVALVCSVTPSPSTYFSFGGIQTLPWPCICGTLPWRTPSWSCVCPCEFTTTTKKVPSTCARWWAFFYINMYSSILFLSLISLDRYLKIIKPVWVFRIQKTKWSHTASYIVWVILISGTIPFFSSNSQKHPCDKICFHFHSKGPVSGIINLTTVVLFLVFYVAFLCFYVKITKKLRTMSMGNGDPKAQSRKKRVIMKTFLVPAIFTLCFLPYHAVRIPYVLAQLNMIGDLHSQQLLHILNESTLLLSALNSCLDPIIYYFLSSAYRKTILCAIQGKFKNMHALNRRRISINRSLTEI